MSQDGKKVVYVGLGQLTLDQVLDLAHGRARVAIDQDEIVRGRIGRSAEVLSNALSSGQLVYGVTTGYGDSCETHVPMQLADALAENLVRYHGCGTGNALSEIESAAVLAVRLAALSRGYSGVRLQVLERLCELLNRRILPHIPEEGSVGASGDLTPLSYVAAVLTGDRYVLQDGGRTSASDVLSRAGLLPLRLAPREALAIMNGTSVMTALACLSYHRARRLAALGAMLCAMSADVLLSDASHFDDRIFALKPHPGQRLCAQWIREGLAGSKQDGGGRLQERYSIRCAPHVLGVLVDCLHWVRHVLEIETNGVNDNPILDPDSGMVLHGGNFYGGHVALAMDTLKTAVANVADLMDRQLALLCSPTTNNGLPANLVARQQPDRVCHHGFKAMQISSSALAAEACKLTMPASVFSRSTECHNQDKVSMGTIAARDCRRVLDLTETVAVIELLACCQAVDIRGPDTCGAAARRLHAAVRQLVDVNVADRAQDSDIQLLLSQLRSEALPIGPVQQP